MDKALNYMALARKAGRIELGEEPVNAITRAMERRADTFACKKGYGDDLVSALKRLHKDSLSNMNPHPLVVKLEYNHPALHERINLVEKIKSGKN